jgi:hypothetical protein
LGLGRQGNVDELVRPPDVTPTIPSDRASRGPASPISDERAGEVIAVPV